MAGGWLLVCALGEGCSTPRAGLSPATEPNPAQPRMCTLLAWCVQRSRATPAAACAGTSGTKTSASHLSLPQVPHMPWCVFCGRLRYDILRARPNHTTAQQYLSALRSTAPTPTQSGPPHACAHHDTRTHLPTQIQGRRRWRAENNFHDPAPPQTQRAHREKISRSGLPPSL